MLNNFDYVHANTLENALEHLETGGGDSIPVSGGTDVLVQMRYKTITPKKLVDLRDLKELKEIKEDEGHIYIGASVTFDRIINDRLVQSKLPVLVNASKEVGSPQIRNVGTLAGNVQTASPAGDGLLALYALDAKVEIISKEGTRQCSLKDFLIGPKKTDRRPDEIIKGFIIPKSEWNFQQFFKKGKRNALAISIVNGAVLLNIGEDKTIRDARIALGAVAPTPIRLTRAEKALIGNSCTEDVIQQIRDIIKKDINPISDIRAGKEYRKYIAAVMCGNIIAAARGGIC